MAQTKQFAEETIEKGKKAGRFILSLKEFIERTGIYIFFISLILFTQISWIRRHIHRHTELNMEARILAGVFIGALLSLGVIWLIKKIAAKINKEPEALLNNLSIALAPGIFFLFASKNKNFLIIGAILCVLAALYIWVKSFREFLNSILHIDKFRSELIVKDNNAVIKISGVYEKADLQTMQSFLIDLALNLNECSEMKRDEVKVDIPDMDGKDENELKAIIEPIAGYFNLRIIY